MADGAHHVAIVGAGPAALIAAEMLAIAGQHVSIYDRMPNPGRKLLIAGRGGLNLTHSEPLAQFLPRYGRATEWLAPSIEAFPPEALRDWCEALGEATFIGSSGRVFPKNMKAVGLLRAWLRRLDKLEVKYYPRHRWLGWHEGALHFSTPQGDAAVPAEAMLLALGGASWPRLGSDGSWVGTLQAQGVRIAPLQPANCGFTTHWSDFFRERFAGEPLKPLAITHGTVTQRGEALITDSGLEGGLIYALSAAIRDAILHQGYTTITFDLRPDMTVEALEKKLGTRGSKSLSSYLRSAGFSPLSVALLHETTPSLEGVHLAARLKALPITLRGTSGIARAISSAGGVTREEVDEGFMLRKLPGVFVAGEMLDWEAPTGGYLLQGCFSTGVAAAKGMLEYLKNS